MDSKILLQWQVHKNRPLKYSLHIISIFLQTEFKQFTWKLHFFLRQQYTQINAGQVATLDSGMDLE